MNDNIEILSMRRDEPHRTVRITARRKGEAKYRRFVVPEEIADNPDTLGALLNE